MTDLIQTTKVIENDVEIDKSLIAMQFFTSIRTPNDPTRITSARPPQLTLVRDCEQYGIGKGATFLPYTRPIPLIRLQ